MCSFVLLLLFCCSFCLLGTVLCSCLDSFILLYSRHLASAFQSSWDPRPAVQSSSEMFVRSFIDSPIYILYRNPNLGLVSTWSAAELYSQSCSRNRFSLCSPGCLRTLGPASAPRPQSWDQRQMHLHAQSAFFFFFFF